MEELSSLVPQSIVLAGIVLSALFYLTDRYNSDFMCVDIVHTVMYGH